MGSDHDNQLPNTITIIITTMSLNTPTLRPEYRRLRTLNSSETCLPRPPPQTTLPSVTNGSIRPCRHGRNRHYDIAHPTKVYSPRHRIPALIPPPQYPPRS